MEQQLWACSGPGRISVEEFCTAGGSGYTVFWVPWWSQVLLLSLQVQLQLVPMLVCSWLSDGAAAGEAAALTAYWLDPVILGGVRGMSRPR
jgi:hypothetical protein